MANALYAKYRQAAASWSAAGLSAPIDLATDTIKVAAVTSGYAADTAADQYLSSVVLGTNGLGTPQTLAPSSTSNGTLKAANVTIPGVASGTVAALVVYKDTGNPATSPLIARLDTVGGLPFTAVSAVSVSVAWDGTNGIFTL